MSAALSTLAVAVILSQAGGMPLPPVQLSPAQQADGICENLVLNCYIPRCATPDWERHIAAQRDSSPLCLHLPPEPENRQRIAENLRTALAYAFIFGDDAVVKPETEAGIARTIMDSYCRSQQRTDSQYYSELVRPHPEHPLRVWWPKNNHVSRGRR